MAKEQKNSPNDMDTITMWATVSSLGADARYKRPLHITSRPVDVANGTDVPEVANTRTVIQSFDGAKVQRNSEITKEYMYEIVVHPRIISQVPISIIKKINIYRHSTLSCP